MLFYINKLKILFLLANALLTASKMWWDEISLFQNPNNLILTSAVFSSGVGHFTQVSLYFVNKLKKIILRWPGVKLH